MCLRFEYTFANSQTSNKHFLPFQVCHVTVIIKVKMYISFYRANLFFSLVYHSDNMDSTSYELSCRNESSVASDSIIPINEYDCGLGLKVVLSSLSRLMYPVPVCQW